MGIDELVHTHTYIRKNQFEGDGAGSRATMFELDGDLLFKSTMFELDVDLLITMFEGLMTTC